VESEASATVLVVERAAEALDADAAAIVGGGKLIAAIGYPEGTAPVSELGAVEPGLEDSAFEVPGVGRCAAAAAPLGHPPGAKLVIVRRAPLTPEETGLLRGIARVASMRMSTLRLLDDERASHAELARLAQDQAALRRVATLVARAVPRDEIYAAVAEEIAQRLGADVGMVFRHEADNTAVIVGGWGLPRMDARIGTRLEVAPEGVAASVLLTHRPTRVEHFEGPPGSVAAFLRDLGVRCAVGSPVVVEDHLWGVAVAASARPEALAEGSEVRIVEFTELIVTAIANADARTQLRRVADEQAALRRVATLVARGEPASAAFQAVAEEAGRVVPAADVALVGRYAPERTIEFVAAWSKRGDVSFVGDRVRLGGRNVSTLVFDSNEPARVDNLADDAMPATALARSYARCSVGAPIVVEGRLWGVTIVGSRDPDGLAPGIEQRLADFTPLLGTAIANAQSREELRRVAEEQAALRRVATLVAREAPATEIFDAVTEEIHQLLHADETGLSRYDPDGLRTVLAVRGAMTDSMPVGFRLDSGASMPGVAELLRGRPARVDAAPDGTAVDDLIRAEQLLAWVASPIVLMGRTWGQVAVFSRHGPLPGGTEERLADFTELVATAIANASARSELMASRARIVASADETRRKIERDLHDGAQQRLLTIALKLRAAQAAVPPDLQDLAAELDGVVAELNRSLDELRELARGVHPAILSEGGVGPAIKALVRRTPVPVMLDLGDVGRLAEPVEVAAYYVASEALTNATRHANASVVEVNLELRGGTLRLAVKDDGRGGADMSEGTGMVGLVDRAAVLGGMVTIESPPGEGTCVVLELPTEPAPQSGGLARAPLAGLSSRAPAGPSVLSPHQFDDRAGG